MTDQMSSFDREKIASVVERAFVKAQDGADPSIALAEEATEAGLTGNQTKRACEALNVSRTLSHYKSASGLEKAATFPGGVADPDKVAALMYPDKVDVPVEKKSSIDPYEANSEYSLGDDFKPQGELGPEPELHPVTPAMIQTKLACASKDIDMILSNTEQETANAFYRVEDSLTKIAGMVSGLYGDSAQSIEDEIIRDGVTSLITKAASEKPATNPSRFLTTEVERCSELIKLANEAQQVCDEVKAERDEFYIQKQAIDASEYDEDYPEAFRPMFQSTRSDPLVSGFINTQLGRPSVQKKVLEGFKYNPFDDPKFTDVRRTKDMLNGVVMLNDLIKNDEVLSKADPKEVTKAFSGIFNTMPELSRNPEMARAAVRYSIEYGGIDFPTMLDALESYGKGIRPEQEAVYSLRSNEEAKNKGKKTEFLKSIKGRADENKEYKAQKIKAKADLKEKERKGK